ncbi:MAG: putative GntR family transcriptional regulator [Actinotalea sp.]|nr:putative GntR family transcriptional regulator [Actinotalea sp.]
MITGAGRVLRESAVPYYVQVTYALRSHLRTAPPHTALPSEQELQELFDVSRTVVRQALRELTQEGLVYSQKGKGSFVAPPKVTEGQIQRLTSFTSEMSRHGFQPETEVLEQGVIEADPLIAERLEVAPRTRLVVLRRLRKIQGEPFMMAHTWIPHELCPRLEHADLVQRSLYEVLETDYRRTITRGSRTLEAVAASTDVAVKLEIPTASPVVRVELVSYGNDGRAVEYSVAFHRGDRARFRFEINNGDPEMELM